MEPKSVMDIETLLSKRRLDSYDGDLQAHLENLKLIGKYTHKIALIEIALHNSLDYLLSAKDADWINNSTDSRVIQVREKALEKSKETSLDHESCLSKMTLGVVTHIIEQERLFARVLNAEKIQFERYDSSYQQKRIFIKGKKGYLSHYNKAEVALNLFHTLRNRCYHWENSTKTRQTKEGRPYPRITTKIFNIYIGIYPDKTERFLDDLMAAFSEDLLRYSNRL